MNNGMPSDYGFNMPEQGPSSPSPPPYGFSQQPPMPSAYSPAPQGNDAFGTGQFTTQLLAQPIVANMAMEYGNAVANAGKQQLEKYVPITALRYYFAVDIDYVMMKLMLLFFPFTHKVNYFQFFCEQVETYT